MRTFGRTILNTIFATIGGSIAGGAAGGAALALISNFPDFSKAVSLYAAVGGMLLYLMGISAAAFLGTVGGVMFGILPTLVLGSLLSFLRNVPPFHKLAVWVIAGAITGFACFFWGPFGSPSIPHDAVAWASAWGVGGATSMMVYWAAGIGRDFAKVVK